MFLTIPHIVLSVAVFRPDRNPEITQTLNDLSWFLMLMPIGPFVLQACVVALAILQDPNPGSVYRRRAAWFSLLFALLEAPGFMVTFFKSGIFPYNGLFTFWIPLVAFSAWLVGMAMVTIGVVRKEADESDSHPLSE